MRVGKKDSYSGQVLLKGSWLVIPARFFLRISTFNIFFFALNNLRYQNSIPHYSLLFKNSSGGCSFSFGA